MLVLRELAERRNVRGVNSFRLIGRLLVITSLVVAGCGSSSNPSNPSNNAAAVAGAKEADAGVKEEAGPSAPDAGGEFAPDAAPVDTTAIPNLPANTWQYVPIQGAMCRDGSPTGIGVNVNPGSKNLMIYLEGGGACFNALTCATNPATFGMTEFTTRLGGTAGDQGVFSRTDTANAMADWNFVYIPFCTGDVHAGNKLDATVPGVTGKQQFVGYANVTRDLARIIPTFPGLDKVLLTGVSAGGFGAAANYPQTAKAFGSVPVYSLDDSGPPMADPYAPSCLQAQWAQTWGFDKTVLADCGSDCKDPTNYTIDATMHTAKMYPKIPFGIVEDTDDGVITLFYGFGAGMCTALIPTQLTADTFTAGLLDSRMRLAALPNVGGFIFQGTVHTTLGGASFDTRTAGSGDAATVKLTDWVATLINSGTVTNVGP